MLSISNIHTHTQSTCLSGGVSMEIYVNGKKSNFSYSYLPLSLSPPTGRCEKEVVNAGLAFCLICSLHVESWASWGGLGAVCKFRILIPNANNRWLIFVIPVNFQFCTMVLLLLLLPCQCMRLINMHLIKFDLVLSNLINIFDIITNLFDYASWHCV